MVAMIGEVAKGREGVPNVNDGYGSVFQKK